MTKGNPPEEAGLEVDIECQHPVILGQQRRLLRSDKHRGTKASKYSGRFGSYPVDQSNWTMGHCWEVSQRGGHTLCKTKGPGKIFFLFISAKREKKKSP